MNYLRGAPAAALELGTGVLTGTTVDALFSNPLADVTSLPGNIAAIFTQAVVNGILLTFVGAKMARVRSPTGMVIFSTSLFTAQPNFMARIALVSRQMRALFYSKAKSLVNPSQTDSTSS